MEPDDLNDRTWVQLKACVLTAAAALQKMAGEGSADAETALQAIEHILSPDWEGPAE